MRRHLYTIILERQSVARVQHDRGILSYVVDVKAVADRVDGDLARYRDAMALINVEDEAIQGGAASLPRVARILRTRSPTYWRKAPTRPSCARIILG